ncbi:MAG: DUF6463 family protein [Gemmatimonadaceae bacterium]|jgi:hypothetical protein|nr:DUF6463 family protein [Gemmatimonadaceae bacterium]
MTVVSAGTLVIAIGVLHTIGGLLLGAQPLADILRDGYVGAVDGHFDRMAIAWFLLFGFALMLAGDAIRAIERSAQPVPPRLGYALAAIALIGAMAMPVSGFWLALIPVGMILQRARRHPVMTQREARG